MTGVCTSGGRDNGYVVVGVGITGVCSSGG